MTSTSDIACHLCGSKNLRLVFTESNAVRSYSSYLCSACNLHQTLGIIDPVSPDYIDLEENDLTGEHVYIQRRHKFTAFQQWQQVMADNGLQDLRGKKLLDIGCGVGGFLEFGRALGLDCYGFDASPAQIVQAQKTFPNVRHAESLKDYITQLGGNLKFDMITMWDVFEHIRTPDTLLNEIRDHLSAQGLLYVSVPNGAPNQIKVRLANIRGRKDIGLIPWEHVFYYTPKSLRIRLGKAGLDVVKVSGVVPYQRKPLNSFEIIRRAVHHTLRMTPYALQIYGLAKLSSRSDVA